MYKKLNSPQQPFVSVLYGRYRSVAAPVIVRLHLHLAGTEILNAPITLASFPPSHQPPPTTVLLLSKLQCFHKICLPLNAAQYPIVCLYHISPLKTQLP